MGTGFSGLRGLNSLLCDAGASTAFLSDTIVDNYSFQSTTISHHIYGITRLDCFCYHCPLPASTRTILSWACATAPHGWPDLRKACSAVVGGGVRAANRLVSISACRTSTNTFVRTTHCSPHFVPRSWAVYRGERAVDIFPGKLVVCLARLALLVEACWLRCATLPMDSASCDFAPTRHLLLLRSTFESCDLTLAS